MNYPINPDAIEIKYKSYSARKIHISQPKSFIVLIDQRDTPIHIYDTCMTYVAY
ncbi:hypothetical protein PUN28_007540 [Cardiocondyla obscurior]|uniref:Uncharacterized protein n=1 Tax=Cardiocondyla obscurior TaxID=286306 RepID=A0AAW2G689_9HYME